MAGNSANRFEALLMASSSVFSSSSNARTTAMPNKERQLRRKASADARQEKTKIRRVNSGSKASSSAPSTSPPHAAPSPSSTSHTNSTSSSMPAPSSRAPVLPSFSLLPKRVTPLAPPPNSALSVPLLSNPAPVSFPPKSVLFGGPTRPAPLSASFRRRIRVIESDSIRPLPAVPTILEYHFS
eukprot:TRINITY_DN9542_c0_g1_i1.p1 TRINITY_DN9542_c0_g1~~TRINITY_DN9542_c0_g1_i1.p1  ORF type:complete len:183 (-),score=20.56 TRINITY_DN9542_c0_g1_i1:130-678(-)